MSCGHRNVITFVDYRPVLVSPPNTRSQGTAEEQSVAYLRSATNSRRARGRRFKPVHFIHPCIVKQDSELLCAIRVGSVPVRY